VAGALALLASEGIATSRTEVEALYDTVIDAGNLDWTDDGGDGVREPLLDVSDAAVFDPVLEDQSSNTPPTAGFTATCSGLTCTFDGTSSSDADGTVTDWAWTFADGAGGTGSTTDHTWAGAGTWTVELIVTDDDGATGSSAQEVTVTEPPAGPALVVASEGYRAFGGKQSNRHLDVGVGITDGASGVASASVTVRLSRLRTDGTWATVGTRTSSTDSAGNATLSFRDVGPGCYDADVTSVEKSGYTWDGDEPTATFGC
jgi:hypothetical protein